MTDWGRYGESLAREYLAAHGYRILASNFRFHHGEIDIVAEEGDVLVFCEVKTRTSDLFGSPESAVPPRKQQQIRRIARHILRCIDT
jgi:putative endonuclease